MIPNDIRSLNEAYLSVYNQEDFQDNLFEEMTLLETIDDLYDNELEEIVEETIYDMLDEGYEFDEIEEIFEDLFSEARVDMAARAAERNRQRKESEASAKEARRRGASVVRKEKRAATISKVKGAVGSGLQRVRGAVQSGIERAREAGKEAKFKAVDAPAAKYAAKRGIGGPAPGLSARSKDPSKRRALRGAVLKDIGSRAKAKLQRGAETVRASGERAVGAVKSSSDTAQARMRAAASSAKANVKKGIRGAALNVARSMKEEQDLYDLVLEHLLDEGYADTEEAATVIMANMSEEWRTEIIEG